MVRKSTKTVVSELPAPKIERPKVTEKVVVHTKIEKPKKNPITKSKPTKRKGWKGTLFKCQVGCRYPYWDSEGNDYDENLNLIWK